MSENWEEFNRLTKAALWALDHPAESQPIKLFQDLSARLRLYFYPVDGPYKSWTLFLPRPGRSLDAAVRCIVWDRPLDRRRFDTPADETTGPQSEEPTIQVRITRVSAGAVQPVINELALLRVPVFPSSPRSNGPISLCGLIVPDEKAKAKFEWDADAPANWAELHGWFTTTTTVLESLLNPQF
ncbi:MAG: hypothetical protein K1X53_04800 [Candidatus Sumerlaeaceae bacterium]|nr:hypothetical protein [Candidatus Sumerlaeaceae bacterium]